MIPSIALGPDVVVRTTLGIEIYTPWPMPDWDISPHRPTVIRFHGDDFLLVGSARPSSAGSATSCSAPTRRRAHVPGKTIVYDLQYVRERERARREQPLRVGSARALWCLAPLFGFAPSRIQRLLHHHFGLLPATVTWASVIVEYGVALIAALVIVLTVTTAADWLRSAPDG